MSAKWFEFGVVVMKIKHVEWREGVAFYRRRVPRTVQKAFGKNQLFFSLKTRDPREAASKAQAETNRLDREWAILKNKRSETAKTQSQALGILRKHNLQPGQWQEYERQGLEPDRFIGELLAQSADEDGTWPGIRKERLPDDLRLAADLFYAYPQDVSKLIVPTFSEVVEKHLYFHPNRSADAQFKRSVSRFLDLNGDLSIDQYRRAHGNAFVENMRESGLKRETIKRYLNQIRPVFETARVELEISLSNPLSKLKIPELTQSVEDKRTAFDLQQVWAIQKKCQAFDDQRRWVVAMLSDTGARLSEIAGLMKDDAKIESELPHIVIQANDLRGLKTTSSERKVPLEGEALWAAKRAVKASESTYLFPGLIDGGVYNNGTLSAALNKWLRDQKLRNENQPLHSLRHAFRDRLRNSGCPPDIADRLGGWKRQGIGESYGEGHELAVLHRHLAAMLVYEAA